MSEAQSVVDEDLASVCARAENDLSHLEGSRVLVTGGGGFLGHTLVQALLWWNKHGATQPIRVTVADNWTRGRPYWLTLLDGDPHLDVMTFDVAEPWPADVASAQWVVHAATIASPTYYRAMPIETMDANVDGLRRALNLAQSRGEGFRGLLFFSSSEVYGDPTPENIPTPETYVGRVSFTGPRACYDESKRFGETLCVNYAQQRGVPVSVARPFNNYGPGLSITDRRVIPDFARDIVGGRDVTVLSAGTPTRTFCYVADAMVGYLAILVRGRRGEAYNVGADNPEISIRDLADRMVSISARDFGYEGQVTSATSDDPAYLADNPERRCPDLTKLRTELGVTAEIGLDEGLRRSLVWYHAGPRGRSDA